MRVKPSFAEAVVRVFQFFSKLKKLRRSLKKKKGERCSALFSQCEDISGYAGACFVSTVFRFGKISSQHVLGDLRLQLQVASIDWQRSILDGGKNSVEPIVMSSTC